MSYRWQAAKLATLSTINYGYTEKASTEPVGPRFLRITDIRTDGVDWKSVPFCPIDSAVLPKFRLAHDDIVFARTGATTGKSHLVQDPPEAVFASYLIRLRLRTDQLLPRFLNLYFQTADYWCSIEAGSTGSAQGGFNARKLGELSIRFPPPEEQRRIVAILDEAFEGIATAKANAEKNLQNARALFDGYLQAVFSQRTPGWTQKRLEDVCDKITDGTHQTPKYFDSGVVFLSSRNVTSGRINWENVKHIDEKQHLEMHKRVAPRLGDILLAKNGTTGVAAIVDRDTVFDIYVSLAMIRSRGAVVPRYLLRFINSPAAKEQFNKRLKGIGVPNLHLEEIREVLVQFPESLGEQQKIIDELDELHAGVEYFEGLQRRKLAALDQLKKSLLKQAFTGQLTSAKPITIAKQQSAPQTTTPQFAANIIALAYARHAKQQREKTLGRVKAQKLLHLVEAIGKIDLDRDPMKAAAGPNDFRHMLAAEAWAKESSFFEMVKRDKGYDFRKLKDFDKLLSKTSQALGPHLSAIESLIDLLVPMDSEEAEVFTTVHAAWNNLLIDGAEISDNAIVLEARDKWHPDKLSIPESKFRDAINIIRRKGLVPDGTGKYVGPQRALL